MTSISNNHNNSNSQTLVFEDGAVQFRQRLAVSLLSHRPILIRNIRANDLERPGLQAHEASFLRLLDAMTNGTQIEINSTGTQLRFRPGVLLGGIIEHSCPVVEKEDLEDATTTTTAATTATNHTARSIGWFLEGILPLAPFGKDALTVKFQGITDGCSDRDPSPDYWRASAIPLLKHFGLGVASENEDPMLAPTGPYIKILRRGAAPLGGGFVEFYCPIARELKPLDLLETGKIKRIRGLSVSCKLVSSSMTSRAAYAAKGLLQRLLPDIWIVTDVHTMKKHNCGPSPSLSMILTAESNNGTSLTVETGLFQNQPQQQSQELPEDVGQRAAAMVLEEVRRGGVVDTSIQSLTLLLMCLTPEDVSRVRLGPLTQYTIESLRLFKQAFGVEFKVKPDHETKTVTLTCLGMGYRNMARAGT